jgi:integrase
MSVEQFKQKLEAAKIRPEQRAFLVLLWHCGVRKSEAYERVNEDIEITENHVIVDFHQRKKTRRNRATSEDSAEILWR